MPFDDGVTACQEVGAVNRPAFAFDHHDGDLLIRALGLRVTADPPLSLITPRQPPDAKSRVQLLKTCSAFGSCVTALPHR